MLGFIKSVLSGGVVGSVERIASEWITTAKESAEAAALMVKVLDPNGKMRRDLSRFACRAYGFYLAVVSVLAMAHAFDLGNASQTKEAMEIMTELFTPITASWTAIVTASFGVNATNSIKGK